MREDQVVGFVLAQMGDIKRLLLVVLLYVYVSSVKIDGKDRFFGWIARDNPMKQLKYC